MIRIMTVASAIAMVAGCAPEPSDAAANGVAMLSNAGNMIEPAPTPVATHLSPPTATGVTREWLIGSWSYADSCATDFAVHYEANGKLDDAGDAGTWALDGDTVTRTVTERYEMGEDVTEKIDPPDIRRYTVTRVDQNRAIITIDGRKVPILRC